MGEILYFKNCEERKIAEEILEKNWPEASFVVMQLNAREILKQQRIHFGKWDINVEDMSVFYNKEKIKISDRQWEILDFLMSDSDLEFDIKQIAYALNFTESDALAEMEGLLNILAEKRVSPIIKEEAGRYRFEEIVV